VRRDTTPPECVPPPQTSCCNLDLWPWPWKSFSNAHSHDEYVCQDSLKSLK